MSTLSKYVYAANTKELYETFKQKVNTPSMVVCPKGEQLMITKEVPKIPDQIKDVFSMINNSSSEEKVMETKTGKRRGRPPKEEKIEAKAETPKEKIDEEVKEAPKKKRGRPVGYKVKKETPIEEKIDEDEDEEVAKVSKKRKNKSKVTVVEEHVQTGTAGQSGNYTLMAVPNESIKEVLNGGAPTVPFSENQFRQLIREEVISALEGLFVKIVRVAP